MTSPAVRGLLSASSAISCITSCESGSGTPGTRRSSGWTVPNQRSGRSIIVLSRIGISPRQHPVREHTERVQIGAAVESLELQRFGRRAGRRAHDVVSHAHRRHRAEVDQLRATVGRASHVARRHVAVQKSRDCAGSPANTRCRKASAQTCSTDRFFRSRRSAPSSSSIV